MTVLEGIGLELLHFVVGAVINFPMEKTSNTTTTTMMLLNLASLAVKVDVNLLVQWGPLASPLPAPLCCRWPHRLMRLYSAQALKI